MARYDIRTPRLYVEAPLGEGAAVALSAPQTHYLLHVLRLKTADSILLFNGRDGEWRAQLQIAAKRHASLQVNAQIRAQDRPADLYLWFAPLKHARLDYMVQKAVEMGVRCLQPVMTRHTQVTRVNTERMRANIIEAAEQCGILTLAEVALPLTLDKALAERDVSCVLIFCDENAEVKDPLAALASLRDGGPQPLTLLVGPEGGFAEEERAALLSAPNVVRLSLGPRILRGDTAAVAALALVQAALGDWR